MPEESTHPPAGPPVPVTDAAPPAVDAVPAPAVDAAATPLDADDGLPMSAPVNADGVAVDAEGNPIDDGKFLVRLDNFTGPFDLLLQLIGKHKLDVTEVALHQVTDDFIAYIRAMGDDWDLGEASEFLLVAATLLDLKAARLLPAADVEDEEDLALLEARDLLFARLLQYKAYKEAASHIMELEINGMRRWPRDVSMEPRYAEALPELVLGVGPERLFKLALKQFAPKPGPPEVSIAHIHQVRVSVREHATLLRDRLRRAGQATFSLLVADCENTLEVVARFLALLELYREGLIDFEQPVSLDELTVRWIGGDATDADLDIDDYEGTKPDPDAPPAEPITDSDVTALQNAPDPDDDPDDNEHAPFSRSRAATDPDDDSDDSEHAPFSRSLATADPDDDADSEPAFPAGMLSATDLTGGDGSGHAHSGGLLATADPDDDADSEPAFPAGLLSATDLTGGDGSGRARSGGLPATTDADDDDSGRALSAGLSAATGPDDVANGEHTPFSGSPATTDPDDDAWEPDDSYSEATTLSAGSAVAGIDADDESSELSDSRDEFVGAAALSAEPTVAGIDSADDASELDDFDDELGDVATLATGSLAETDPDDGAGEPDDSRSQFAELTFLSTEPPAAKADPDDAPRELGDPDLEHTDAILVPAGSATDLRDHAADLEPVEDANGGDLPTGAVVGDGRDGVAAPGQGIVGGVVDAGRRAGDSEGESGESPGSGNSGADDRLDVGRRLDDLGVEDDDARGRS